MTTHPTRHDGNSSHESGESAVERDLYRGQMVGGIVAIVVAVASAVLSVSGVRPDPGTWVIALGVLLVAAGITGLVARRRG